jgi:hypothetical protein
VVSIYTLSGVSLVVLRPCAFHAFHISVM